MDKKRKRKEQQPKVEEEQDEEEYWNWTQNVSDTVLLEYLGGDEEIWINSKTNLAIVFKGPVAWTGKMTELDRTAAEEDRFVSNWFQPVATGL